MTSSELETGQIEDGDGPTTTRSEAVALTRILTTSRLHVIDAGLERLCILNEDVSADSCRLWISLFVSAMDGTIVTTALIKISSSFGALDRAAWLVTAYLLTYNGTNVIS